MPPVIPGAIPILQVALICVAESLAHGKGSHSRETDPAFDRLALIRRALINGWACHVWPQQAVDELAQIVPTLQSLVSHPGTGQRRAEQKPQEHEDYDHRQQINLTESRS